MGKRKNKIGLTGVSHFVLDAFNKQTEADTATQEISAQSGEGTDAVNENEPANKRRKTLNHETENQVGAATSRYYVTGLVPHYTDSTEVPKHLQKYFAQRFRLFSLYSTPPGCLLDETGWFSVTPERVADQIAERCRCGTILDAFCGVGGNAIAFAKTCERVIAMDTSSARIALARHNAEIYGVADRIEFVIGDYVSFADSYLQLPQKSRKIDVVFLSPPWGGISYLSGPTSKSQEGTRTPSEDRISPSAGFQSQSSYSLSSIEPISGTELFTLSQKITQNIAYYLPRNTCLDEVSALLTTPATAQKIESRQEEDLERVEVEEEWMGAKLKALTCYFGGLAHGQEMLFDDE